MASDEQVATISMVALLKAAQRHEPLSVELKTDPKSTCEVTPTEGGVTLTIKLEPEAKLFELVIRGVTRNDFTVLTALTRNQNTSFSTSELKRLSRDKGITTFRLFRAQPRLFGVLRN